MKKYSEAQKRYALSERGKLARKKYQESAKGRETHRIYLANRRAKIKTGVQMEQTNPVEKKEEPVKIKVEAISKK
jgi:hypothetical protein